MQCPRCNVALAPAKLDRLAVERCPQCKGNWLASEQLPKLEATVEADPDWRDGTIEWYEHEGKLHCPVCGEEMETFNYRDDGIDVDTCKERHGYWLDAHEDDEVRQAMKERVHDLKRSRKAEVEWGAFIYKMARPSWLNRLDHYLKGSP